MSWRMQIYPLKANAAGMIFYFTALPQQLLLGLELPALT
jgi:hypothetical protein